MGPRKANSMIKGSNFNRTHLQALQISIIFFFGKGLNEEFHRKTHYIHFGQLEIFEI